MTGEASNARVGLVVGAAAIAVWWARAPFAASSLWAEDGRNWLQDAVEVGAIEAFGRADAGYYHFLPRVAGALASWFPIEWAALIVWIVGALVVGWFAFTTFTASRTWLASPVARAILALALVALPVHREESIGNVANLHFVMLFVGLIVLISEPGTSWQRWNGVLVLVALGLSTPLVLALAPFAAWRVLRTRPWSMDRLTLAWVVGVAGQFVPILLVRPERPPTEGASLSSSVARFVTDVGAHNFVPTDAAARATGVVVVLAVASVLAAAAISSWRGGSRERAVLLFAVPAIGALVYAISSVGYGGRPRYALFPALCLLWSTLVATETLASGLVRVRRETVFALLGLALAVAWVPHWTASGYRRSSPDWETGVEAGGRRCRETEAARVEIVIGPTEAPEGRSWSVRLPCTELTG